MISAKAKAEGGMLTPGACPLEVVRLASMVSLYKD